MRRMNRKGEGESMGYTEYVRILFAVLLVLLLLFIGYKILSWMFQWDLDDDAVNSFDAIADNIELMARSPSSFQAQTIIWGSKDRMRIIAYSGNVPGNALGGAGSRSCGNNPCLCLYKETAKLDEPTKCRIFDAKTIKKSSLRNIYFTEETDNPGKDDTSLLESTIENNAEGQATIHIDKRTVGNDLIMYFLSSADYGIERFNTKVSSRMRLIQPCPAGSDAACIDKRKNSNTEDGFCQYDEKGNKCLLKDVVSDCAIDTKINDSCICGEFYVTGTDPDEQFCHKHNDDIAVPMPFDCKVISECADYCNAITSSGFRTSCDNDEIGYCHSNFCELSGSCVPDTWMGSVICRFADCAIDQDLDKACNCGRDIITSDAINNYVCTKGEDGSLIKQKKAK